MSFTLVDEELEERLAASPEKWRYLFLDASEQFLGYWEVHCFDRSKLADFDDLIGSYRVLAPSGLEAFMERAEEAGYKVAFFEDPASMMAVYEHLNDDPPFEIRNGLGGKDPDDRMGWMWFQIQGFNYLKDLHAGVARWDTGTGKTVLASALAKYHGDLGNYDLCWFVVKKNNKVNTVRKLKRLLGIEAIYITGSKKKRLKYYNIIREKLAAGERVVVVTNYEKFNTDMVVWKREVLDKGTKKERTITTRIFEGFTEDGDAFFDSDLDLMYIWDEMPVKLKTRTTRTYLAICNCLYSSYAPKVNWDKRRSKNMRSYMLSATPIENNPGDWYNCVRLQDPRVYGVVSAFENEYVNSWNWYDTNKPETWHKLDKIGLTASHMVHDVDKKDPRIRDAFPEQIEDEMYIDWDERDLKFYDKLIDLADELQDDEEQSNIAAVSLITLCQMLCDAPSMVLDSAARRDAWESVVAEMDEDEAAFYDKDGSEAALRFLEELGTLDGITDDHHTKLEKVRELLLERHPDSKAVLFTRFNKAIMPVLEEKLQEWGISYVRYDGTDKQKQDAEDRFRADPDVRVFLSSDQGSDSIDLEAAQVIIHYDLPWKWTTKTQRENRIHRATSTFETVYIYTLIMAGSVEERILEIIMEKKGYHDGIFKPGSGTMSASARFTKEDWAYILRGRR